MPRGGPRPNCTIDDCTWPNLAKGMCRRHHYRWRRYGDPHYVRPPSICAIENCGKPVNAHGHCNAHHKRFLRWGDPNIKRPKKPAHERFWVRVDKEGPLPPTFRNRGRCWTWTGGLINTGYGMFHPTKGSGVLTHRYAYEALVGPIPEGLCIDHLCRNRRCCNPAHLEPVTMRENTRRGLSISTFNALKTHCPQRHPYSPENTYVSPRGGRICRTCARERDQYRARPSKARQARKAA